jgi:hypothetical protein
VVHLVFRVDAALDGVPALEEIVLPEHQLLASRDPQLPLHQINAGSELRDRVLHLDARVHFGK